MPYYLTAKNGNKFLSIPIEDKHKYFDTFNIEGYILKTSTVSGSGMRVMSDNVKILFNYNDIRLNEGTGSEERVGDKVMLKAIQHLWSARFNGANLINNFGHGDLVNLNMKFRLMLVHFDEAKSTANLATWFNETFVPNYYGTGSNTIRISNQAKLMRESTPYTGKFKIIADETFNLTREHTVQFSNLKLSPNKQLTFDTNGLLTNDDYKNTYLFVISPSYNDLDLDAVSQDHANSLSLQTQPLFTFACNTKITYIDV